MSYHEIGEADPAKLKEEVEKVKYRGFVSYTIYINIKLLYYFIHAQKNRGEISQIQMFKT